jgi:methionyl-tRNA formyltransferase
LTASDRIIDWSRSAAELHLQVRALSDRMPVRCEVNGVVMQILQTANLPQEDSKRAAAPGTITACTKNGITVQCGAGELVITRLKLNKGKGLAMHAADALNGYGEILHTGALIDSATRTS